MCVCKGRKRPEVEVLCAFFTIFALFRFHKIAIVVAAIAAAPSSSTPNIVENFIPISCVCAHTRKLPFNTFVTSQPARGKDVGKENNRTKLRLDSKLFKVTEPRLAKKNRGQHRQVRELIFG